MAERLVLTSERRVASRPSSLGAAARAALKNMGHGDGPSEDDKKVGERLLRAALRGGAKTVPDQADAVMGTLSNIVEKGHSIEADSADSALNILLNWVTRRAMSDSRTRRSRGRHHEPLDDESDEEPGHHEETGLTLDDKVDIHRFMEDFADDLEEIRSSLSPEERILFEVIFDDGVGDFRPGIEENMGQSTALKAKMSEALPDVVRRQEKRWSGYAGDLRRKLLHKIEKYVEEDMPETVWDQMHDVSGAGPS